MFTGIIEALGKVRRLDGCVLAVEAPVSWRKIKIGSSVAVHGVCLTVVQKAGRTLFFNVVGETLSRTMLGRLKNGDRANLERAMRMGDRYEGHLVLGHVDGVGQVSQVLQSKSQTSFLIRYTGAMKKFMVEKGSIAVNGVSMTLGKVTSSGFWIHVIPHTLGHTHFGWTQKGALVNLEADLSAKFLHKLQG